MSFLTLTAGEMPTREQYDMAWDRVGAGGATFSFGNDKRLGNCELSQDELWDELQKANLELLSQNELGDELQKANLELSKPGENVDFLFDWVSSVLANLGIEWI